MTISKELFLAVLAMDSYNRGYDVGLSDNGQGDPDGLGDTANVSSIGNATVINRLQDVSDTFEQEARDVGFYAIAYEITDGAGIDGLETGDTVISYRGTDTGTDYTAGWSVGAGLHPWSGGIPAHSAECVSSARP